jgi:hypothetical protein
MSTPLFIITRNMQQDITYDRVCVRQDIGTSEQAEALHHKLAGGAWDPHDPSGDDL